uniref:Uncharacterized protein n=1 Tax=Tanacetum cinerariifolium TaxID=118510 RepID=A0A6L2NIE2_TANCI|nr:hypothetical protein [Tanacetum cinerariifolium]
MDPSSSVGKTCLGENLIEMSSDMAEGHGDWNSPEFHDTTNNGGKKETKATVFHKMDTEEIKENMISNEFAMKLCLYHEVKHGNKVVKKELVIALRGENYFVKFIINLEEDDVEPGVVFGRSLLRLTKAIANFENETITIYPELDPFLFVCKIGKSSRNKRKQMEKYQLIYSDIGPSMSTRTPLTQKEAERGVLAIIICERDSLLEEERPVIKTMTYSDKYKKILNGICLDKMKLGGMNKEEEEAIIKIKGEALIENDDLKHLEEVHNVKKGITVMNHSKAKPMRLLSNVMCQVGVTTIIAKFLILDMPIDRDTPILTSLDTAESDSDDEEEYAFQRNKFGAPIYRPKPARKICVWKKVVSLLGSLYVALQHVEWKPDYTGCLNKKKDSDGQWHAEIRLTDPYRNIYDQGEIEIRASMQDLYERMGSMKIRQGAIERMAYRQSYYLDRYVRVFEHMVGVYSVPLQGAYNPPGYDQ